MIIKDLKLISYAKAWQMQQELHAKRLAGDIPNTVLLLEHEPVFTKGRRDCEQDILSSPEVIAADGIEIVQTNRGGKTTYHGPGQLICYLIFSIKELGVKRFVEIIEEICLATLADFGVAGKRDPEHPGIWSDRDKIVAIGLHVHQGVTQHGFAINVSCNLDHYRHIVPCGIKERGQTSLVQLLSKSIEMDSVKFSLKKNLSNFLRHLPIKNAVT